MHICQNINLRFLIVYVAGTNFNSYKEKKLWYFSLIVVWRASMGKMRTWHRNVLGLATRTSEQSSSSPEGKSSTFVGSSGRGPGGFLSAFILKARINSGENKWQVKHCACIIKLFRGWYLLFKDQTVPLGMCLGLSLFILKTQRFAGWQHFFFSSLWPVKMSIRHHSRWHSVIFLLKCKKQLKITFELSNE